MNLPSFFESMPALDVPFPEDVVTTHAVRSDAGLVAFFRFHKDMDLPRHAHGAQWGTVIAGEIVFTIGDETRTYGPGDSYDIPAGVEHGAKIRAGTVAVDVFAEADCYPLKAR
ncbi:cupin domain-containing protein [Palleronia sp. KMU-117]|uniref:cupin domain-containing protein n=1 Tax=Palleronia sp. KMU-117 TaxID=3434108 RepID=UPI003D72A1CD